MWYSESVMSKAHSLVRGEESNELSSLEGFNLSYSVNIEVSPGFFEVFIEIFGESCTLESFVSGEGFLGKGFSSSFCEPVSWGVVVVYGSLENVVSVGGEPGWSFDFSSGLNFLLIRWVIRVGWIIRIVLLNIGDVFWGVAWNASCFLSFEGWSANGSE